MSAWGIGATNATRRGKNVRRAGADPATVEPAVPSVDTVVTWIPGEVIASYAAIVLALQPEAGDDGVAPPIEITWGGWLIAGVVFAGVLTWLGGWSKSDNLSRAATRELAARVILAGGAFGIWSAVVPGSWWYSIDRFAENPEVVTIVAGIVGATFAMVAEGTVRRVAGKTP